MLRDSVCADGVRPAGGGDESAYAADGVIGLEHIRPRYLGRDQCGHDADEGDE